MFEHALGHEPDRRDGRFCGWVLPARGNPTQLRSEVGTRPGVFSRDIVTCLRQEHYGAAGKRGLPTFFSRTSGWAVGIATGRYDVRYSMLVGDDYFDGDSHYRLPDIEREAQTARGSNVDGPCRIQHYQP